MWLLLVWTHSCRILSGARLNKVSILQRHLQFVSFCDQIHLHQTSVCLKMQEWRGFPKSEWKNYSLLCDRANHTQDGKKKDIANNILDRKADKKKIMFLSTNSISYFRTHLRITLEVHEDLFSQGKFGYIEIHREEVIVLSNYILIIQPQLQHILGREAHCKYDRSHLKQ